MVLPLWGEAKYTVEAVWGVSLLYLCAVFPLHLKLMTMQRDVSLVLSSGGARGYAHIGAIEVLEERGYRIRSVAGTSMGALVGAMYAAGRLEVVKNWACGLTRRDVLSLIDWSLGMNHIVRGDRVMNRLHKMVPDMLIEDLKIPFRAVAADLVTQREVVFSHGSLYRSVRASISIPAFFKPVKIGRHILVDGGMANPLPLNRAVRTEGDLLVSVNVSAPMSEEVKRVKRYVRQQQEGFFSLERFAPSWITDGRMGNYFTLLTSCIALLIQRNTVLRQQLTPVDVAVEIPMNRFGVFDFDQAERIIRVGRELMADALDRYEAQQAAMEGNATDVAPA